MQDLSIEAWFMIMQNVHAYITFYATFMNDYTIFMLCCYKANILFLQNCMVKLCTIWQIAIKIQLIGSCLHGHIVICFWLRRYVFIQGMIRP